MKVLFNLVCMLALGFLGAGSSLAQSWPNKPVRIVTAFGPGSASDIIARLVGEELQAAFAQPFLVENKPGASGVLAAELVSKAAPDGYTLFLSTNTAHSVNPHLFKKLPYDPITGFSPISRVCLFPFALAVPSQSPVRSIEQFVSAARLASPRLSYAYGNTTGQIAGAALALQSKFEATPVAYKSSPQALTDLSSGQVGFMFIDLASSRPYVQSGKLRLLAVSSEQRSAQAPELPTVAAAAGLSGFDLVAWVGVLGPAGLAAEITTKINAQIQKSLARKEVIEKLAVLGADLAPLGPQDFERYMREQLNAWGRKVKDAGIQAE